MQLNETGRKLLFRDKKLKVNFSMYKCTLGMYNIWYSSLSFSLSFSFSLSLPPSLPPSPSLSQLNLYDVESETLSPLLSYCSFAQVMFYDVHIHAIY